MPAGDAAAAIGWAVVNGNTTPANETADEINTSRDLAAGVYTETRPVARGGTGATSAPAALTALGAASAAALTSGLAGKANTAHTHDRITGGGRSAIIDGTQLYVNTNIGVDGGHVFVPSSSGATSGYTVAYINGDGRISRGVSTEQAKKHISLIEPKILGDIFPDIFRFQMRNGDGSWTFGWIAERLAESEALRPFVVWETEDDGKTLARDGQGNPIPLSIDFISLLIVQVAQLNVRVSALEAKEA